MLKEQFINYYKNSPLFDQNFDVEKWYETSVEAHKELTQYFGGTEVTLDMETEQKKVAPYNLVEKNHKTIYTLIPDYFKKYYVSSSCWAGGIHLSGIFEGKRISSTISRWMTSNKISRPTRDAVNNELSETGKIIRMFLSSRPKAKIKITWDPYYFTRLGSTSVDQGSCFRDNSTNRVHKYILGQSENTFIGLINEEGTNEDGAIKCHTRFWGILKPEQFMFVTNKYSTDIGSADQIIFDAAKILLKADKESIYKNTQNEVGGVWTNSDGYCLSKINNNIDTWLNTSGLDKYRRCFKCSSLGDLFAGERNYLYCTRCAMQMRRCEFSGVYCVSLYAVFNEDDIQMSVCSSVLHKHYTRCSASGKYYKKELVTQLGKAGPISDVTIRKLSLKQCPLCLLFVSEPCDCKPVETKEFNVRLSIY